MSQKTFNKESLGYNSNAYIKTTLVLSATWVGRFTLALSLLLSSLLARPALAQSNNNNDWITYGWDVQRTGYNPMEVNSALGPTTAQNLRQLWASDLGGVSNAQPVYAHNVNVNGTLTDILYIGTEDGVFHAVNAANGTQIWNRQLGAQTTSCEDLPNSQFGITATAVLDRNGAYGDRVYVIDGKGMLYALDLATGATLPGWPVNILDPSLLHAYGALNLFNGNIYAVAASYCDDSNYQGKVLEVSNVITSQPALSSQFLPTSPPGATGSHYGGGVWGIGGASIDPSSNTVYVATGNALPPDPENYGYAEQIVGLDLSLKVISSNYAPLSGSGDVDYGATPLLFNPSSNTGCQKSLLVAENKAGNLPVYDRSNLNSGPLQNSQISPSTDDGRFIGIPAFSPQTNYVYVSNPASLNSYKNGLLAFQVNSDCTLSLAWQYSIGQDSMIYPYSPPTVANGVVYMTDGVSGDLFAFNAASGGPPLAKISNLGTAFAPPIVVDGRVYIGTYSHKLYSFTVTPPSGSSLGGSGTSSATAANLTTEGTADWLKWGVRNVAGVNRKAGVTDLLTTYTQIGAGTVARYTNDPRPLSWTDGTPTTTGTNNTTGVYIPGVGSGFSFTAPADTTTRTLTVHVGGWNSGGTLVASLSDGSAYNFQDVTPTATGQYDRNYVLTYNAASAGQTLTVGWTMSSGTGNVTLNGAALTVSGGSTVPVTGVSVSPTSASVAVR